MNPNKQTRFTVDVFGRYTWGKKAGQVNPNAFVTVTCIGKKLKDAVQCLAVGGELPTYKVVNAETIG